MLEDQKQREQKRQQLLEQKKKAEEEEFQKSTHLVMSTKSTTKNRTLEEFIADQARFEQNRFEKLKLLIELEEQEAHSMFKPTLSKGSMKILEKKQQTQVTTTVTTTTVENQEIQQTTTQTNTVHERLYSTNKEKAQS